jgi:hypothetical protein
MPENIFFTPPKKEQLSLFVCLYDAGCCFGNEQLSNSSVSEDDHYLNMIELRHRTNSRNYQALSVEEIDEEEEPDKLTKQRRIASSTYFTKCNPNLNRSEPNTCEARMEWIIYYAYYVT